MGQEMLLHNLLIMSPEIALIVAACLNLLFGIFCRNSEEFAAKLTSIIVLCLVYLIFKYPYIICSEAFDGSYINNKYTSIFKMFILGGVFAILVSYIGYFEVLKKKLDSEYVALILFSVAGSFVAISARDLIVLFVGLELQSLPSYILAAYARDNEKSSEAGLKYFILGALSSAILLFGASLLYGSSGSVNYAAISDVINKSHNIVAIVGVSMIMASMMFKLSIAPFHMWTPDVYEGAPIISVTIFASIHKIASLGIFVTLLSSLIGKFGAEFIPVLKIFAVLSLIIGAFGGIFQTSIKRLMGYSAILNAGYVMLAIIVDLKIGIWHHAFFTYMIIYSVAVIGFFISIAAAFGSKADDLSIEDLYGLGKTKKAAAASMTIMVFSMLGIPPLAGFFGKYYVIYDLISISEYKIAVLALTASIIAAYYYLRIVKSIYFHDPLLPSVKLPPTINVICVISVCTIFILSFVSMAGYFAKLGEILN